MRENDVTLGIPKTSYRNLIFGLSFWPDSADSINLFSDAFGPRGGNLNG